MVPSETNSVVFFFFFFETGWPANSLSTKNEILSTCSCHQNRIAALGFPTRYRASRFGGNTRILAVHSPSGPKVLRFPQCQICFWPNRKASCTKIFIMLHVLSSELDSFFRLTPTCLGVRVASIFFVMRNMCLKSGSQCPRIVQLDLPRF